LNILWAESRVGRKDGRFFSEGTEQIGQQDRMREGDLFNSTHDPIQWRIYLDFQEF
jgi:hypothetical protein